MGWLKWPVLAGLVVCGVLLARAVVGRMKPHSWEKGVIDGPMGAAYNCKTKRYNQLPRSGIGVALLVLDEKARVLCPGPERPTHTHYLMDNQGQVVVIGHDQGGGFKGDGLEHVLSQCDWAYRNKVVRIIK